MWPELLLKEDLERITIFGLHSLYNSLILQQIQRAGRVYHLATNLQCVQ
jgi:hypothetical protein